MTIISKEIILEYITQNSNHYFMSNVIYEMLYEQNIIKSYGKKQYRKNREDNSYIDEVYKYFKIDITKYTFFLDVCLMRLKYSKVKSIHPI
ncbi:putative orfan [Tupanvirus soda lake]|uniref:Orfan n=2 Tax=Tupanvirus TaxID=2094720 RepID=A0AC62AAW2_9VIRU|nr:putative orfan [Tupanvirus soda lake]QKU34874.1 putative orfan [Tupanvirus soda lake]